MVTGSDGVAACCWRLDGETLSQRVEATLLEIGGKPMVDATGDPLITPLRFNAKLSLASQLAYNPARCENLNGVTTVQEAIDRLCMLVRGGCEIKVGVGGQFDKLGEAVATRRKAQATTWCLYLLPGEHQWPDRLQLDDRGIHVSIGACSPGVRLHLDQPLSASELASFTLTGMTVEAGRAPIAMRFGGCRAVTITNVTINAEEVQGNTVDAVVRCLQCGVLTMQSNTITASKRQFLLISQETERVRIYECHLDGGAAVIGGAQWITLEHNELTAPSTSEPALNLRDGDAHTTVHANLITGLVSFYGWPGQVLTDEQEFYRFLAVRIREERFSLSSEGGIFRGWGNHPTRFALGDAVIQNLNDPESPGVGQPI